MTVYIMTGYIRILQRTLQHYQLDLIQLGLDPSEQHALTRYLKSESGESCCVSQYVVWLQHLQHYLQQPIGIIMARQMALQDVGLIGYLASSSVNLQQALRLFQQYYPLLYQMTQIDALDVRQQGDTMVVQWHGSQPDWQLFYVLNVCLLHQAVQLIVEPPIAQLQCVELGQFEPTFWLQYEQFFGCSVQSSANIYALHFPVQALATPNFGADAMLHRVLVHQAEHTLRQQYDLQQQLFKYKVQSAFHQVDFAQPSTPQQQVAQQLHCSVRTLQRQLQRHQLDFQSLLDHYRYQVSCDYLQQEVSLAQIAESLGYADQSAFGRAFKRWAGMTPKSYQRHYHQRHIETPDPKTAQ